MHPGSDQKQPPHSAEAEIAIIGSILNDNSLGSTIAEILKPEHFAIGIHRTLFDLALRIIDAGDPADAVLVSHIMKDQDAFKQSGGSKWLIEAQINGLPEPLALRYAQLVYDLYLRRELIAALNEATRAAYDDSDAAFTQASSLIQSVEESLSSLSAQSSTTEQNSMKSMQEVGAEYVETIDAAAKAQEGEFLGVPTGIRDLDKRLTGLKPGEVTLIAARPAMGKSVLALQIARHATSTFTTGTKAEPPRSRTALVWIGEMSRVDLFRRMAAAEKGIPVSAQTSSGLDAQRADDLIEWAMQQTNEGLHFDDTPFITIPKLRRRLTELKRKRGTLDLLVVDYLNLTEVEDAQGMNEHQRISRIIRGLTQIAKAFQIPVVAVTQLSRSVEMREDKRPMLSDLRESGSLEQDATNVLLLYRAEYYLQTDPEQGPRESAESFANRSATHARLRAAAAGKLEIICAKLRFNQTGTVLAGWEGSRMRITDVQAPSPPPQSAMNLGSDYGN